jgi:hypothetical protein
MQSLKLASRTRRRIYFFAFVVLFIAAVPIVLLFANGYRFVDWKFVQTGGVALIGVPSDAEVFINYKEHQPSVFSNISARLFFIQNLAPEQYFVVVAKAGDWSWAKHVDVHGKEVDVIDPFLVPIHPLLRTIDQYTESDGGVLSSIPFFDASSSVPVLNNEYTLVANLFATSTTPTADMPFVKDDVSLWQAGQNVYTKWLGTKESIPPAFCNEQYCQQGLIVTTAGPVNSTIRSADFFPGRNDVLVLLTQPIANTNQGPTLYAEELDVRPPQNIAPIYTAPKGSSLDFRIDPATNTLYLKVDTRYFALDLKTK